MWSRNYSCGRWISQKISSLTDQVSPLILSGLSLKTEERHISQTPHKKKKKKQQQADASAITLDYMGSINHRILVNLYCLLHLHFQQHILLHRKELK